VRDDSTIDAEMLPSIVCSKLDFIERFQSDFGLSRPAPEKILPCAITANPSPRERVVTIVEADA
jgi:hypothetical protein